jgi:hypothetical protein
MAKKVQRSFYLEPDIFNYIKTYQDENNLSSISIALERIIFSLILCNNDMSKSKIAKKPIKDDSKVVPQSIMNIRKTMGE